MVLILFFRFSGAVVVTRSFSSIVAAVVAIDIIDVVDVVVVGRSGRDMYRFMSLSIISFSSLRRIRAPVGL